MVANTSLLEGSGVLGLRVAGQSKSGVKVNEFGKDICKTWAAVREKAEGRA